jgi:hypothetical protein
VTLKAAGDRLALLIGYYEGLAQDQVRRDGAARGPVDYYLDPGEPPGRWWGSGWAAVGLDGEVLPEQLQALLEGRHPATGATLGPPVWGPIGPGVRRHVLGGQVRVRPVGAQR